MTNGRKRSLLYQCCYPGFSRAKERDTELNMLLVRALLSSILVVSDHINFANVVGLRETDMDSRKDPPRRRRGPLPLLSKMVQYKFRSLRQSADVAPHSFHCFRVSVQRVQVNSLKKKKKKLQKKGKRSC